MSYAGISHHYGLPEQAAIAAVTSVPAKTLGLDHRIGKIAVGMDGDVVVWDRHPLKNGATPYLVLIEGEVQVFHKDQPQKENTIRIPNIPLNIKGKCNNPNYAVIGAKIYTMIGPPIESATIVVKNGIISCIGHDCNIPNSFDRYEMKGGIIIPGLIESASFLGLSEVEQEPSTQDGIPDGTFKNNAEVLALDGISMQTKTLNTTWNGGITTCISSPMGHNLVTGQSVAFHPLPTAILVDDSLVKPRVALHWTIGNDAKKPGTMANSISGQIHTLRNLLKQAKMFNQSMNPFSEVLRGDLKVAVFVNKADHIGHVLNLKKVFILKIIYF